MVNTNPTGQGLNTVLKIEIDGTNAGSSPCLHPRADDVTIRGLVINRCMMYDIQAEDLGTTRQNFVVEGCFLATNADGTQALSPSNQAIHIIGYQNARIGGTAPADRNLISGLNGGDHIVLDIATGTAVQGNLIGTDVTGLRKITTSLASVDIVTGTGNVIGGTSPAARNVMTDEVIIGGSGLMNVATGNFVQGNFIGTDVTGTTALHCHARCVQVSDVNNTIGGSAPGAGNTIGGSNSVAGIVVQGGGTVIQGNFIGTDETGTARLPNKDRGIWVATVSGTGNILIGGTQPGEGNLIAYNGGIWDQSVRESRSRVRPAMLLPPVSPFEATRSSTTAAPLRRTGSAST